MAIFRVHMINSEFESREESEYASLEAATSAAIRAATRVLSEAVADGADSSAVELRIEEGDRVVGHHVVSLSVSRLLPR